MGTRTVLAWVDLETTGLDVTKGRMLEYAFVFTDLHLNVLSSVQGVIKQPLSEARALMDQYVLDMHTKNGLLAEIALEEGGTLGYDDYLSISEVGVIRAFEAVKDMVSDYGDEVIFVIAGSTVGFDRSFVKKCMPRVEKLLHYRQLDVSSYKVGFPEIFGTNTSDAHRAMPDILASIEHHRKMRHLVLTGQDAMMAKSATKPQASTFDEHDAC